MIIEKIKKNREYSEILSDNDKIFGTNFLIIYKIYNINHTPDLESDNLIYDNLHIKYGFIISKKKVKSAVKRNRIRRRIKEAFNNVIQALNNLNNGLNLSKIKKELHDKTISIIIIGNEIILKAKFKSIENEFIKALNKLLLSNKN